MSIVTHHLRTYEKTYQPPGNHSSCWFSICNPSTSASEKSNKTLVKITSKIPDKEIIFEAIIVSEPSAKANKIGLTVTPFEINIQGNFTGLFRQFEKADDSMKIEAWSDNAALRSVGSVSVITKRDKNLGTFGL
ncbi:MAG: hypothetical protein AB8G77_22345 [Rhodothermales bacterium]